MYKNYKKITQHLLLELSFIAQSLLVHAVSSLVPSQHCCADSTLKVMPQLSEPPLKPACSVGWQPSSATACGPPSEVAAGDGDGGGSEDTA